MFLTFVLASALAMSTVLGLPPSAQMTYVTEDKIIMQSDETPQVMVVGDRSSDLKFVMAIQSSTIWEKIEERWLTINKPQGLDKAIGKKSPDSLSDQELAQLKQACHDGLKCVAVDQLLVLGEVNKPLGDGKVSVRTAIIKITQVLTQYTTEYHKDVYQYEEVKQSDDQSKVNESVTIILEDNKELCQINLKPVTQKNIPPKNADGNTIPTAGNNNNNNAVNTFKNYNINNGTVNNAIVNIEPHSGDSGDSNRSKHKTPPVDSNAAIAYGPTEIESSGIITVVELSEPETQANNGSDPSLVIVIEPQTKTTDGDRTIKKRSVDDLPPTKPYLTTGDKSVVKDRKNDALQKQTRQNQKRDRGTSNLHYYELPTTTDDHLKYALSANDKRTPVGQRLMFADGPSLHDGVGTNNGFTADVVTVNGNHGHKVRRSRPHVAGPTNNEVVDKKNFSSRSHVTASADRSAGVKDDKREPGHSSNEVNIVMADSINHEGVRRSHVEDGTLNNGHMVQYSLNRGTINKGEISGSTADNGIISVGTVNNGPVNYGTSDTYAIGGKKETMTNSDIQQYLANIEKMYSTILERLE